MNSSEQWVASGATQGFEDLCARWESERTASWNSLPETETEVLRMLFAPGQEDQVYPFGIYFCHYYAFRFAPWLEQIAQKRGIEPDDGWENRFADLLFRAACKKERVLIKEIAAIPGMPKQILLDGEENCESMVTAIGHLATFGTKENKDRPSAAILRLLGFAAAIQMFPGDVELFLKKAMKVPDFNLWEKRQFLYFLTFRYARMQFDVFYSQLKELYDRTPPMQTDSVYRRRSSEPMNTETLEFLVLQDTPATLDHTLTTPEALTNAAARHKGLMADPMNQAHVSLRASTAKEILENIDAEFHDLMADLEEEHAAVTVCYQTDLGLKLPKGAVLKAELLEQVGRSAYIENPTENRILVPVTVQTPVDLSPAAEAGEAEIEITVAVDPKFFDNHLLAAWHWDGIPGIVRVGSGEGKLRHAKHLTLSEYLYNGTFPDRNIPGEISETLLSFLNGTDFSETALAKLRRPEQYAGDIKIDRSTILTLAAIETMMELRVTGRPVDSTDSDFEDRYAPAEQRYTLARQEFAHSHNAEKYRQETELFQSARNTFLESMRLDQELDDEFVSPEERVLENHRMFWENVNDRLHSCHYFGIYLLDPYERFLASLMACDSPMDFYRFLWSCKKSIKE